MPTTVLAAIAAILLVALIFGPSWWIRHVLRKHGVERPDLPGTGAELAGLKTGDLLLSVAGQAASSHPALARIMGKRTAGERVPVRIRRGEAEQVIEVELGVLP